MSSSRDKIFQSIREQLESQVKVEMPVLSEAVFTHYSEPLRHFKSMLDAAGAQYKEVSYTEIHREVQIYHPDARFFCDVSGATTLGNVVLSHLSTPHELKEVDVAILNGSFGVAENGAIWVDYAPLRHRVIHAIAKHLVLIVPKKEIVSNMQEAYRRLPIAVTRERGGFICGPSKTADIERVLVLGAHGPHSLLVLIV